MLRRIAERRNSSVVVEPWDAAWASLPDWIWKRIVAERGESWARTFAERMLQRPETWLRLKSGAAERLEGGFEGHPGFKDGTAIVQDPGSQKLVDEVADHVGKGPILDLCSAPGGKAIALAWKGFQVTATDASSSRLELVNQNLSRTGLSGAVVVKALEEVLGNPGIWPTVWIDAPCSGSGTLQKNPEIRWIRTEKDLTGLLRIQRDLIETGLRLLKPGGQLVYTVCSVLKEEARIPSAGPIKPLKEWDFALEFGFQGFCITKT
jgi:16S rRNA (cytosine967-C5)-methyltransferase